MDLISELACHFAEQRGVYRLLVIDSIISLFRCDYSGRGELADRQQKLNQMLSRLTKISEEYNIAVFLTNQVSSDPGGKDKSQRVCVLHCSYFTQRILGMTFVADPKKPVGGHVLVSPYPLLFLSLLQSYVLTLYFLFRHTRKNSLVV